MVGPLVQLIYWKLRFSKQIYIWMSSSQSKEFRIATSGKCKPTIRATGSKRVACFDQRSLNKPAMRGNRVPAFVQYRRDAFQYRQPDMEVH